MIHEAKYFREHLTKLVLNMSSKTLYKFYTFILEHSAPHFSNIYIIHVYSLHIARV